MKKFNYRLQKLLQLKQHRKLQQQKQLAKAERVRRMEEAHQRMLQEKMAREVNNLKLEENSQLDLSRMGRSVFYQQKLNANMSTQSKVILNAKKLEDENRDRLIAATKDEKIYQRLKEKQLESYLIELDHLQQKETDEIAGNINRHSLSPIKKNPRQD